MSTILEKISTFVFVFLILIVGIIQGVTEWREESSVQIFDLIEDSFVVPVERQREIDSLFRSLEEKIKGLSVMVEELSQKEDSIDADSWYDVEIAAEEASYGAVDLKAAIKKVNRHISLDDSSGTVSAVDPLHNKLERLYRSAGEGSNPEEIMSMLEKLREDVSALHKKKYPGPSFTGTSFIIGKALFFHTLFSRKYLRGYESEMEKNSVFAEAIRPPMQLFRYALLRDLGDKAVEGRENWLFYKPGINYLIRPDVLDRRSKVVDPEDTPVNDNPVDTIVSFQNQLNEMGIELLVMITPGKASVYPEMISSELEAEDACRFSNTYNIMEELESRGVKILDLFSFFREARKSDGEEGRLYLEKDTHWNTRGLRLAAKHTARRIETYPWFAETEGGLTEYAFDTLTINREGDVGVMTGLMDFKIHSLNLKFDIQEVECLKVFEITRDDSGNVVRKIPYRDDYKSSKVLVLGDSFSRIFQEDSPRSAGWIAHLAAELSRPVASIISDGGASTLVREKLARKKGVLKGKKLVVWEFVERDLRYGEQGWKDIEF